MNIHQLLQQARVLGATDVHLSCGAPPMLRINGELQTYDTVDAEDVPQLISELTDDAQKQRSQAGEDVDLAFHTADGGDCRVHIYHQRGHLSAAIRLLQEQIPTIDGLHLPPVLKELAMRPRGLILVTGPAGSGKSTTLAAMVDHINDHRPCHILTIEDPIEYRHQHKRALIDQRQLGMDVADHRTALRSALREDPDVLMIGEMRDEETISAVLTAAETGHLVLSTLHTIGAANTVERITNSFDGVKQQQICQRLAGVLQAVVTQILLPCADGNGRMAATEVMIVTDAIASLIRENRSHQITTAIQTGARLGMHTLDSDLARSVGSGRCRLQDAQAYAIDQNDFRRFLQNDQEKRPF